MISWGGFSLLCNAKCLAVGKRRLIGRINMIGRNNMVERGGTNLQKPPSRDLPAAALRARTLWG
jgi:hypothetical protein